MEAKVANIDPNRKTFVHLCLAIAISSEHLKEMNHQLSLLNGKINKKESLYLDCLKKSLEKRINCQLERHAKLVKSLKLKAPLYSIS